MIEKQQKIMLNMRYSDTCKRKPVRERKADAGQLFKLDIKEENKDRTYAICRLKNIE